MPVFPNRNICKDHIVSLLQIKRVKRSLKKVIGYTSLPASVIERNPLKNNIFIKGGFWGAVRGVVFLIRFDILRMLCLSLNEKNPTTELDME